MAKSNTTIYYAMAANGAITVAKGVGGVLSGTSALLAETAHSAAGTTNQVFLRVSLDLGEKPPDEEHPFGHGRGRFFWAFLVAVMMFVGGAIFSIGPRRFLARLRGRRDGVPDRLRRPRDLARRRDVRAVRQVRAEARGKA